MSTRKCIYTNKEARFTDRVIPREKLGTLEIHNWDNKAPMSEEYRGLKQGKMPTELELEANDTFHKLELARIKVKFYEDKLREIQFQIGCGMVKFTATDEWYRKIAPEKEDSSLNTLPIEEIDAKVMEGFKKPSKRASKRMAKEVKVATHEVQEIQEAEKKIKKALKEKETKETERFSW